MPFAHKFKPLIHALIHSSTSFTRSFDSLFPLCFALFLMWREPQPRSRLGLPTSWANILPKDIAQTSTLADPRDGATPILIHACIQSFVHSFIAVLIHPSINSFIPLLTYPVIHPFNQACIHAVIHSFAHSLIHAFIH